MDSRRHPRFLLGLTILAGLFAAATANRWFYRNHPQELWFNYFLLPPVPVLRAISLGHEASLADLLYTSATLSTDYFKNREERVRIMASTIATSYLLDPDFDQAIYTGHYFVEFDAFKAGLLTPENDARRRAASETSYLLLTGFHSSGSSAKFAEVAAQERFALGEKENALHLARLANGKNPDSFVAANLAGVIMLKDDNVAEAIRIWSDIEKRSRNREDAGAKYFNAISRSRILELIEKPRLNPVYEKIEMYKARYGHYPLGWNDMIESGYMKSAPADSFGNPYLFNPNTGKIIIQMQNMEEAFN